MAGIEKRKRGRPRHVPPLMKRFVSITEAQAALLRMWGRGNLSEGLRWLIDSVMATEAVRKVGPPRSSG